MKKEIIKSNIILFSLIIIFLSFIIIFALPKKETTNNYNVDVYKAYYMYDVNSNPKSMTYYLINVNKNTKKETIINKIFTKILKNISKDLEIKNVNITEDEISLTINDDITKYNEDDINALVNSLTEIKNIKKIKFINELTSKEKVYENNINNYYINSPITNKLYTFIYRDNNYKIVYTDNYDNDLYLTIKSNKEDIVTYEFNNKIYKVKVNKNCLYINESKILSPTYKTNDTWDNYKITNIKLSEDDTLLITINNKTPDYIEEYVLKQAVGIYSYYKKDLKNNTITSFKYKKKVFNND